MTHQFLEESYQRFLFDNWDVLQSTAEAATPALSLNSEDVEDFSVHHVPKTSGVNTLDLPSAYSNHIS